jgi:xanthine dehydrogenase YagR molybdenum-binding subunit
MSTSYIGQPTTRVDGRAKVTGAAKFAAEHYAHGLAHGVVITSAVARGTIVSIDASVALTIPGVLQVFTHENAPRFARADSDWVEEVVPPGTRFRPLESADIKFSAQPIALAVAETFELARYAASLVRVDYDRAPHATDLIAALDQAYVPRRWELLPQVPGHRGDARRAIATAATRIEAEYRIPIEHHNPMELFGVTAVREADGKLTVYDKTQGVQNVQGYLCSEFGYAEADLRVLAPFVGGAFGLGLRPQYHAWLAVMAAHELKRSVRVSLSRQQMFGLGYRPDTWQRVVLGASADGQLEGLIHEAAGNTSRFEDYTEKTLLSSGCLYRCDNAAFDYKVVALDLATPIDMRAPGCASGVYALECAMDELAADLHIDPLELRLRNYAESDQDAMVPFSSKQLRECYRQGAERFGWARRSPQPRSMRTGNALVGLGMATGHYDAVAVPASARCVLTVDGRLTVSSATADIGTGTYTIMTQIAAESAGVPIDHVTFELGDSSLPRAPVEGDSFTAASVGSAVKAACEKTRDQLVALAKRMNVSFLADAASDDLICANGSICLKSDPTRSVTMVEILRQAKLGAVRGEAFVTPPETRRQYSCFLHSAVFAEVHVDEDLGTIQVMRVVNAVAAGRILNPITARSQILGGVVWGLGMALEEESVIDQELGRIMNHSFGEYHVPVNADIHDIEVIFVHEDDDVVSTLGAKGVGEIGVVGVAAAIANAVCHATGKRIRELPITLDKLL